MHGRKTGNSIGTWSTEGTLDDKASWRGWCKQTSSHCYYQCSILHATDSYLCHLFLFCVFSPGVESVGKWRLDYGRESRDGCVPVLRRALCLRWLREVYKCSLWNANHMRAVLVQHHSTPSFCPAAVACFPWLMPKKLGSKLFYVMHKWSEPCVWVSLVDCCLQKSYFTVTVPNFHPGDSLQNFSRAVVPTQPSHASFGWFICISFIFTGTRMSRSEMV